MPNATGSNTANGCVIERSSTANGCVIDSIKTANSSVIAETMPERLANLLSGSTANGCVIDNIKTANGCVIAETMPESMANLLCDHSVADAAARSKTACDALTIAEANAILLTDESIAVPNRRTPVPNATGSNTANGCMIESTTTTNGCVIESIKTAAIAVLLTDDSIAEAIAETIAILLTDCGGV